ncbi:hypothetical protein LINGRAHAP2_LOCUS26431 [Linum grandiflorum]
MLLVILIFILESPFFYRLISSLDSGISLSPPPLGSKLPTFVLSNTKQESNTNGFLAHLLQAADGESVCNQRNRSCWEEQRREESSGLHSGRLDEARSVLRDRPDSPESRGHKRRRRNRNYFRSEEHSGYPTE